MFEGAGTRQTNEIEMIQIKNPATKQEYIELLNLAIKMADTLNEMWNKTFEYKEGAGYT